MRYNHILVRFGELTTKGKNRRMFINRLYENTRRTLKKYPRLTYELSYDRLYILLNGEDEKAVMNELGKVFGIHSYSLALQTDSELEAIKEGALAVLNDAAGRTFKVETKRNDKSFPMTSVEISKAVAGYLLTHLNKDFKVDVHEPDIRLHIEVRPHHSYISAGTYLGPGGYPVGSGGRALLMLSGGIDSPVAGYLSLKRGLTLECVHFASPPYTSDRAKEKVFDLVRKLTDYCDHITVHIVPFTDLQLAIYKAVPESYAMTVMRRMMLRIAERVATERHCQALVTGESVGQVASQTLESMLAINAVTCFPVLRPLVTFDKVEIMALARKIGTYDISIRPYEDCCTIFDVKQPATKPKLEKAASYEKRWDYEAMISECVANIETVTVAKDQIENEDLF